MRELLRAAAVAAFALSLAAPALAQETKKPAPPRPAGSATDAVLGAWNYEGGKIVAMAQDFPEDKYDYKPNPAQRSFAEQLLHVAGVNLVLTAAAKGEKLAEQDLPRDKYKTKADIVAAVKKSFDDASAAIKAGGDAGLAKQFVSPWGNYTTRLGEFSYSVAMHAAEHYGQLVVYYRVLNMVPPDSRR